MHSYSTKHFSDLSLEDLYSILQLRQEIFIVEQNCPYLDCDNKDQNAFHVLGKNEKGELISYCRLLNKNISYEDFTSIGRVVTSNKHRKTGEGRKLMNYALEEIKRIFPNEKIKISSQCYISHFYQSLGFEKAGEEYLEDDIPHIAMIYNS